MKPFIRGLPKGELHVHVEGCLEPELLFELARRNGVELPYASAEAARRAYEFTDLQSFLDLYYQGTRGERGRWMVRRGVRRRASHRRIAPLIPLLIALPLGSSERGTFTDPRDGRVYPTVELAGMTWFARDLDFETPESFCYDDEAANCRSYGRLYRWEAAMSACPVGWHLSTEYEWQALELWLGLDPDYLLNYGNRGTDQGARLKEGGDTGFDVTYGGWREPEEGEYEALGENAAYWLANESSLGRAWHRDVDTGDEQIWRSAETKPHALSVRCVKNRFVEDGPWQEPDVPAPAENRP